MNKELELLDYVIEVLQDNHKIGSRECANVEINECVERLKIIYSKLKLPLEVLEIIVKNDVDLFYIKLSPNNIVYNTYMQQKYVCSADKGLTKDEFNKIKKHLGERK